MFGGGKTETVVNERMLKRMSEQAGEIWCVPWTGLDASGKYVCPGFETDEESGLWCWVIPKSVIQAYKLNPAVVNATLHGFDRANAEPGDPALRKAQWMYDLLNRYLRRVKISGFETQWAYHPSNEEYIVRCYGPWARVRSGDPIARRDLTGQRFKKPSGAPAGSFEQQIAASKVQTGAAPYPTSDAAPTPNDSATPGGGRDSSAPTTPSTPVVVPPVPGPSSGGARAATVQAAIKQVQTPKAVAGGTPQAGDPAQQQACVGFT